MRNKVLIAMLSISLLSLCACGTDKTATENSISDNTVEITESRNIDAELAKDVDISTDTMSEASFPENTTVIYESDNFSVAVTSSTSGKDELTFPIILGWGSVENMDMAIDIAQAIYNNYDCGIKRLDDSYETSAGFVTVYEMVNGQKMEVVKFDDHKLHLRDAETSEDFWTSVEYLEVYGE